MLKRFLGSGLYTKFDGVLDRVSSSIGKESDELPNVQETEWFSEDQIIEYQEKRLRKLIQYAYNEIPYYRKLFITNKISPGSVKYLEDLEKIPILTRDLAIRNYPELINPSLVFKTHRSSGTTGPRMKWAYSEIWADLFWKALWRGFGFAGLTPDKRVLSLYSPAIGEISKNSLIIREAFDPNEVENDLKLARNFKPQFAYFYSSSAYILASYLIKADERLPLEGFIVTSDQLHPQYRKVIEEAFQCELYNNYGCNDGGAWGAECEEHSGFHHDFERSILEFDEDGSMLSTDLWNYAMPFIRYKNGDVGKWLNKTCKCGRNMPLFEVNGRIGDFIVTPSNKIISPTAAGSIFFLNECFADYRIIQHSESEIEILYVNNNDFSAEYCENLLKPFTSLIDDMNIVINPTDHIERSSSLKRRSIENRSPRTIDQVFKVGR